MGEGIRISNSRMIWKRYWKLKDAMTGNGTFSLKKASWDNLWFFFHESCSWQFKWIFYIKSIFKFDIVIEENWITDFSNFKSEKNELIIYKELFLSNKLFLNISTPFL